MATFPLPDVPADAPGEPHNLVLPFSEPIAEISSLLGQIDEGQAPQDHGYTANLTSAEQNQLAQVRLGTASSLYAALRWKHEPTAKHSLRVSLACSSWALKMNLSAEQRDPLEVAALLHDIGKIGVPDKLLGKHGPLTPQETAVMEGHWLMGTDVLRMSCNVPVVLDIVKYARAWYDGRRDGLELVGKQIPLGARMLTIVDAFDAMVTDQVYRKAFSRERAFKELYQFAGTQFDPDLVHKFAELHECDQLKLQENVAQGWLYALDPHLVDSQWRLNASARPTLSCRTDLESLFQQKLLEAMYDGVVFVDASLRVALWNRGAERLTGISASSVYQTQWLPSLLDLRDEIGQKIADEDCPVAHSLRTNAQWLRRLTIRGRGGRDVAVDAHAVPVTSSDGTNHGLTLQMHDVSPEISLEARCQSLHERATRDPLTQVANRAEFDRVYETFVATHLETKLPCSMVICDIDHFKLVNDNFGHQAGDQVIQSFATLLKTSCRQGDLVARYGGEEFVVLCADCDNAGAARRAEEFRRAFTEFPQPALGGKAITASFGVTEVQPGDTPQTMLRRADRALLMAKDQGRNRVVQLGIGSDIPELPDESNEPLSPERRWSSPNAIIRQELMTEVPLNVSIEKLRGFVSDHHAEVVTIDGRQVQLKIGDDRTLELRRSTDRPVRFLMDLRLEEERLGRGMAAAGSSAVRTRISVAISLQRFRDRRRSNTTERARQLLTSFRAYLMATLIAESVQEVSVFRRAKRWLTPWLGRRDEP